MYKMSKTTASSDYQPSPSTLRRHVAAATPSQPFLPPAVLDSLAARLRADGLHLALINVEGEVVWHDPVGALFFQRYAMPSIQYPQSPEASAGELVKTLTPRSPHTLWSAIPGLTVAAFPCVKKRHPVGFVLAVARSRGFSLNEDNLRACSRLGLDGPWLAQQAEMLPAYKGEDLERHSRLLSAMIDDQMRLDSMTAELEGLSTQLATTYEELSLIYQISGGMKINRGARDFFKQACLDVLEVMAVQGMGVALHEDNATGQEPVLYGSMTLPPGHVQRMADQLIDQLSRRKSPLIVNNLRDHTEWAWLGDHARNLIAVPLQRQDKVLGCLFGLDKQAVEDDGEFDSQDSKLLNSIANESAIYLENAKLFGDVHGLMMGLLHSLTSAVDAKDPYTCGHSERVAMLSRALAQEVGLGAHEVERIYMAGLLHDVGKIGVPESVLQKAGRLTAEEFDQMKKHPEIGARILHDIKQVADIIPGVLHHHERFDGKGYPAKLHGENIPMMGRIICLADCFDAMTSNRTYRNALPLELALIEIRRCAGTQFDPRLAEAFLRIESDQFRTLIRDHQQSTRRVLDIEALPAA